MLQLQRNLRLGGFGGLVIVARPGVAQWQRHLRARRIKGTGAPLELTQCPTVFRRVASVETVSAEQVQLREKLVLLEPDDVALLFQTELCLQQVRTQAQAPLPALLLVERLRHRQERLRRLWDNILPFRIVIAQQILQYAPLRVLGAQSGQQVSLAAGHLRLRLLFIQRR